MIFSCSVIQHLDNYCDAMPFYLYPIGVDYSVPQSAVVTFLDGSPVGTVACVNVILRDDTVLEGDEIFIATINPGSDQPALIATPEEAFIYVTILEDTSDG